MTTSYLVDHHLRRAARTRPEAPAVIEEGRSISYAELDARADCIASLLIELDVTPGSRVGIHLRKSIDAVTAIYGVLRAGAVYVPLDPSAPESRVAYIASNCGIEHLMTGSDRQKSWEPILAAGTPIQHIIVLDTDEVPASLGGVMMHPRSSIPLSASAHLPTVIGDDLAFILYTSGSTGDPKGVMLSHTNCRAFVDWAVAEFEVGPDDRLSSHAPFHFDLSTFDLFGAAAAAAPVVLVPPRLSVFPIEVIRFIERNEITVWYSVPSILSLMVEHGNMGNGSLPSLRVVLFAGEVFPTKYLSRLMRAISQATFANLYGPTETNVCTWHHVTDPPEETDPPISIGRAIDNVETFVVDEADRPVEPGTPGELLVRGPTVMKGYWGDLDRTRERLVQSPLAQHHGDPVYRTGDLVIEEENGSYTFLGRRDNQIKSRGYRIELGDIESAIHAHPGVLECAVVAIPDEVVTNRIHAYVNIRQEMDESELSRFCAERIPRYMVPERFIMVRELPKTSTGKIDRQAIQLTAQESP